MPFSSSPICPNAKEDKIQISADSSLKLTNFTIKRNFYFSNGGHH
jgi:hypothetical protein